MTIKTYYHLLFISSPKIHTNLLWDLTWLFIGLAILYFLFIFFFKRRSTLSFFKRKGKRAELAPIISNFLFHSPEDPRDEQKEYVELKIKIREYLGNTYFRNILADILFDLQKDVAGGTRERLYKLFVELGLHHDSYSKLSSWRWNTISQGILELSQMKVTEGFYYISKFINDKRGVVRKQAEIAIVSLKADGINHLLDTTKYSISEWQQLRLIETLANINDFRPPKFKAWLISHNKDVVLFSLRLIKHFNQNEAGASIAELVKHKNDEIKIAAISCIKDFNFSDALGTLKKVFWNCTDMVKIQILEAIGQIGDEGDLMFLNEVGKEEDNFAVTSKAFGAINAIAPDSVLPTKDIIEDLVAPVNRTISGLNDIDFLDTEVDYTEVITKPEKTKIEIEEVEVYDLIEEPETDIENATKVTIDEKEVVIEEMELELDRSLNGSLGLINSKDVNEEDDRLEAIQNNYEGMSIEERNKFVDTIESVGDKREIPLLEFIMEHEEDTELRFKAFNTLKQVDIDSENEHSTELENISKEQQPISLNTSGILPEHSIFYELYQYASDENSKEILVKEMMEVGDQREIPFLEYLLENENNTLKRLAERALAHINNKVLENAKTNLSEVVETTKEDMVRARQPIDEIDFSIVQSLGEELQTDLEVQEDSDERIPLELCFLYDELGILYDEKNMKEDLGLNFELSKEFEVMVKSENSSS